MKTRALASYMALSLVSLQVSAASQCITPTETPVLTTGKQVEVYIAQDDHPHFKDANRKCSYYLQNYYAPGFKAAGLPVPTQAQCLADPSLVDLSKGFAPFGAFFRSKTAIPDSNIKSYQWVISGPSGDLAKYDAFNAAYVFEKEGTYTAKLTMTLNNGSTVTDQKTVTVWPRSGKTYYVDASLGDDRYNGLSQTPDFSCDRVAKPIGTCSGPWKTATRAFGALSPRSWVSSSIDDSKYGSSTVCTSSSANTVTANGKTTAVTSCDTLRNSQTSTLKAGDTIAFNRGQTFEFETGMIATNTTTKQPYCMSMVNVPHWTTAQGILYNAYGTGAKPKIFNTATASCEAFILGGVGMMHLTLQDLEFNLENTKTTDPFRPLVENRALFVSSAGYPLNLIFNRIDVNKFNQGIGITNPHGEFVKDSTFTDSQVTHMYSETATDVAILNNKFDYSGNHMLYTNMSNSLIVGNKFSRQAFGRLQVRIFGTDPAKFTTKSVWISDNTFEGWIDPRTSAHCATIGITGGCPWENGKRYNFNLVEFSPNNPSEIKFSDRIVFTRNILKNAENPLNISASAHVIVSNNIFDNVDNSPSPRVLLNSFKNAARRPLNDIVIKDNLFTERSTNRPPNSPIFHLNNFGSTYTCDDLPTHKDIAVSNNQALTTAAVCMMSNSNIGGEASCLLSTTQSSSSGTLGSASGLTLTSNKIVSTSTASTMDQAVTTAKQTTVTSTTVSNTVNKTTTSAPTSATTTTKAVTTAPTKSVIKIAP